MLKTLLQIIGVVLAIVLLSFGLIVYQYYGQHNLRVVEPGAFYGSRQMSGPALEAFVKKYNIKTVVNFRGNNPGKPWYDDEVAACKRAGVDHADFSWSRGSIPSPESLARYIELLNTDAKPFLVHCEGGTHRTAVAAACYLLLKGKDVATARKQFGPMFKDAPIGQVVTLYENANMPFDQWVKEKYPALYDAQKK